jgi:hypothetical protein
MRIFRSVGDALLGIGVAAALVLLASALVAGFSWSAAAEDYWTDCKSAYEFCARRPYHRDCSIWTHYGKTLSVNSWHPSPRNPAADTAFCKDNPWHASCGIGQEIVTDHKDCPIPAHLK